MRKLAFVVVLFLLAAAGIAYAVTQPRLLSASDLPNHAPDAANGAYVFNAAGCAACHAAPGTADPSQARELPGGVALATPFGTFYTPNISPDKANGIGGWSTLDFVNALKTGVSPEGRHYYPAFPYTSYQRMTLADMIDLKAYLDTLPPVATPSKPHDLHFPFSQHQGIRFWQYLYVDGKTFAPDPAQGAEVNRGAYLVEALAHCGECHTPRNFFGGIIAGKFLSGAGTPDGKDYAPNITPHKTGIGEWETEDIVELLKTGKTPEFVTVGGEMRRVTRETAQLTDADRLAIAAYLKTVLPIESTRPKK
jgi:mono/diheme cytochrome c family protein